MQLRAARTAALAGTIRVPGDKSISHRSLMFAALAIARYLQDTTGVSLHKIVQALRPIQRITVRIAGHEHIAEDALPPAAAEILNNPK